MKFFLSFFILIPITIFSQKLSEHFVGIRFQKDTKEILKIEVDVDRHGNYSVYYPDLDCYGIWEPAPKYLQDDYTVEEGAQFFTASDEEWDILHDKCLNNSFVILVNEKLSKSTKRFYIYEYDKTLTAFGFLEKK